MEREMTKVESVKVEPERSDLVEVNRLIGAEPIAGLAYVKHALAMLRSENA
jgi:hypothetical protein